MNGQNQSRLDREGCLEGTNSKHRLHVKLMMARGAENMNTQKTRTKTFADGRHPRQAIGRPESHKNTGIGGDIF